MIVKRRTPLQGTNENGLREEVLRVKLVFPLVQTPKSHPKPSRMTSLMSLFLGDMGGHGRLWLAQPSCFNSVES